MLDPHPNFLIGSALLFLAFAFVLAALWKMASTALLRSLCAVVAICVFALLEYRFHHKQQIATFENVRKELALNIAPSQSGQLLKASFELHNNSSHRIASSKMTCVFNRVCTPTATNMSACFEQSFGTISRPGGDGPIDPNGDAQSEQCLSMIGIVPSCADVSLFAMYTLSDIPGLQDGKEWRFATTLEGGNLEGVNRTV
jgi:hypothetical protein